MKNLTAIISLILVISTCKASACNFSAVNVSTGKASACNVSACNSPAGNAPVSNVFTGDRLSYTSSTSVTSVTLANVEDNKTSDILSRFTSRLKSLSALELEFSIESEGSRITGTIHSQKHSYRLINNQMEVYCDGKSKWIYNKDYKEVTIFKNDTSQTDITENPAAFFNTIGTNYSYDASAKSWTAGSAAVPASLNNSTVPAVIKGKQILLIELRPKDKKAPYTSITLGIEKGTLNPLIVAFLSKDGSRNTIWITRFGGHTEWPSEYFVFSSDSIKDLTISDLR